MWILSGEIRGEPIDDIGEWDDLVFRLIETMYAAKFNHREAETVRYELALAQRDIGLAGEGFSVRIDELK